MRCVRYDGTTEGVPDQDNERWRFEGECCEGRFDDVHEVVGEAAQAQVWRGRRGGCCAAVSAGVEGEDAGTWEELEDFRREGREGEARGAGAVVCDEEGAGACRGREVGVMFDLEVIFRAGEVELLGEEVGPGEGGESVAARG